MASLVEEPADGAQASPYPLFDFNRAVASTRSLDEICEAALICLRDSLGVEKSSILLFEADGIMHFRSWDNLSEGYRRAVDGHSPWTRQTVDPEPVLVPDVRHEPSLDELAPAITAEGIVSLAFFPLLVERRLLGKCMIYYPEPHVYGREELLIAQTIAAHVAWAIDRNDGVQELIEQREHLEAMFHSDVVGIIEIDMNARFVQVNDRFCQLVGRSREELLSGMDAFEITHPEDRAETQHWIQGLLEGAPHFTIEKRYVRPDGSYVWVSKSVTGIRDEAGGLKGAVGVITDVTERKETEQALAERSELIQSMTDNMSVGLLLLDRDGGIEFMNPAAERLTGYGFDDVKGKYAHDVMHYMHPDGTPYPRSECPIDRAYHETARLYAHEDIFIKPDGTLYNAVCNVAPLVRNGERFGAVLDIRDITIQKRAEMALRESEESMRQAALLKDQFLGLVSHELRTPISTILGNALLLQRRGDRLTEEDKQQSLADIASESDKLQEIIENLLLLTRLEAGQMDLEPLVLQQIIQESIDDFHKRRQDRPVTFHCTHVLPAQGESTLISLVMRNLLSNADKYTPGPGSIDVDLRRNGDGMLQVSVTDHGIGMEPDDTERVFNPFFRSQRSKPIAKGMGLGLAVCKRIVEAQGGAIWVESVAGEGSTFYFTLQPIDDAGD